MHTMIKLKSQITEVKKSVITTLILLYLYIVGFSFVNSLLFLKNEFLEEKNTSLK